jgi:hypothetical protein
MNASRRRHEADLARAIGRATDAAIASLFKTSFLAKFSQGRHLPILRESGLAGLVDLDASVASFYELAYARLRRSYRCEYVFKNEIVRRLVRARHPSISVVVPEFAVGGNRIDMVVVNGTTTAYEIKTAYDSLDRLPAQIAAALRVFDRVIVACAPEHIQRVVAAVSDDRVGILEYTPRGGFRTERECRPNATATDPRAIFDCLRADEYVRAVRNLVGESPLVPNTQTYRTYAPLFASLPSDVAHGVLIEALGRRFADPSWAMAKRLPASMAHIYYETPRAHRARLFADDVLGRRLGSTPRGGERQCTFRFSGPRRTN